MSSAQSIQSPRPPPTTANTQVKVIDTNGGRILCLADIRGKISMINELARETGAKAVIHTGDFGFFDNNSLDRINDRTLRHLVLYSPLISPQLRQTRLGSDAMPNVVRQTILSHPTPLLSEFPLLLSGALRLHVPVYTVWGACEDVQILEKFRTGEFDIENLTVLDEATTRCLDIGGVKLRLFGLGGALVMHKLFDNGEGRATIAGGQGTMWTTALQIGELVDTAQRTFDPTETRLLVTHASPGREGLLAQLGLVLKADLFISGGLHFRYSSSYNEFSVQTDMEAFRTKILSGQAAFNKVWESVKVQVEAAADENQRQLFDKALSVVARVPQPTTATGPGGAAGTEEPAWKNCWHWNLCDAAYGNLILDIKDGRISADLKSQGFNYAYRRTAPTPAAAPASTSAPSPQHAVISSSSPAPTSGPSQAKQQLPPRASPAPAAGSAPAPAAPAVPAHTVRPPPTGPRAANGVPVQGPNQQTRRTPRIDSPKEKEGSDKEKSTGKASKPATPKPADKTEATASSTSAPETAALPEAASPGPAKDGASSAGGRTPTTRRPPRNPHTLFMNKITDLPVTEAEIRDFFLDAKSGITFVKIPINHHTRQQKGFAYVEFGDEETMKAALEKHAEKLKNCTPRVVIAEPRDNVEADGPAPSNPPTRGGGPFRGAGRGGRGGFARNSVVAAAAAAAGPTGRLAGRGKGENGTADGSKPEPAPSSSPASAPTSTSAPAEAKKEATADKQGE